MQNNNLPRQQLPRGEFRLSDLPGDMVQYSGDLGGDGQDLPRSVHMAFAIALTNADQYHAADQGTKADTLDAIVQAWRSVTPADTDVIVEYSRSATSIDVIERCPECGHDDVETGTNSKRCLGCFETWDK